MTTRVSGHGEFADTELIDPRDPRLVHPQRVSVNGRGMVSSAHYLATAAGVEMFERGGNAVDAAVATAFALGVVEPAASGLGGQSMAIVRHAGSRRNIALDGGSRAPHRVSPGELDSLLRRQGHKATTVPSTPAVLAYALERYGSLPLATVLEPAIRYADDGYPISPLQHFLTRRELKNLRKNAAAQLFLRGGRTPHPIGSQFRQPALARTLRRLAEAGVTDFYQGEIARAIHADMEANDGYIRDDDLAQIPWPVERRPLSTHYGPLRVFTFPPPGAGRTLIEALNILNQFPDEQCDPDSRDGALLLAHVIRRANLDRADQPENPALYPQELELGQDIIAPEYAERLARRIRRQLRSHGETTHVSAMDEAGNVIGLTQSIERVYGSFAASPELGFLYNNYMSAFEYQDITHPYYLRPNAVPWASVAPTILYRGRRPWLVIGSPGSERIVSAILQVVLRLQRGATPFDAVEAPRLHCSVGGKVSLEASRMRDDVPATLARHGFTIDARDPYSFYLGSVQLVMRDGHELIGVADPRRDGSAGGPA
ncbi:MAG: gamma-glutamyltransferase family protein [Gammaproteobacteria bacterium]